MIAAALARDYIMSKSFPKCRACNVFVTLIKDSKPPLDHNETIAAADLLSRHITLAHKEGVKRY